VAIDTPAGLANTARPEQVIRFRPLAIVARLAFNVHPPTQGFGFVITLALAAVVMLGLGAVVALISNTPRIANAIATLLFFPTMFFAGL
jgi:ABC-2 type transport system permease protein